MLSQQQIQDYQTNGYLILKQLFCEQQTDKLKSAAQQIVNDFQPDSIRSIFSTRDHAKTWNQIFLNSADKVCCFFEEDAFDSKGQLKQQKSLSINKIGHALHTLEPTFREFSRQALIKSIANNLGLSHPQIRQSMYIFKQPKIGGEINWHQDASYFHTEPSTVTTFWLALEDANLSNGCLQVQSGGHHSPLRERFIREQDDRTYLKQLDQTPWPEDDDATALPVKKGSLVIFHGYLPHYSSVNLSDHSRQAYVMHLTCKRSRYDHQNWLQATPWEY